MPPTALPGRTETTPEWFHLSIRRHWAPLLRLPERPNCVDNAWACSRSVAARFHVMLIIRTRVHPTRLRRTRTAVLPVSLVLVELARHEMINRLCLLATFAFATSPDRFSLLVDL